MMIEIKRLTDCTINEAVKAWNVGFEGYYFDATTTAESFVSRIVSEGLSPQLSIVAFKNNEPIGIVKNGVRTFNDIKIGWNGGTGVASKYRSLGVGQMLMEETISIYKEEGVQVATLEAISDNQKAIALYEKIGYEVIDQLEYLELKGVTPQALVSGSYQVERAIPQQINSIPFYKGMNPWQTHWQNARDGEAIIIKDTDGGNIGYAFYRRAFNADGVHVGTTLFQCEANPERKDTKMIIRFTLSQVFGSFSDDIRRLIPNLPLKASHETYSVLKELGFQPIAKQVLMSKKI
jgi:GNAT superfamily N-acetyltransferase